MNSSFLTDMIANQNWLALENLLWFHQEKISMMGEKYMNPR